jgi:hypothetical protein
MLWLSVAILAGVGIALILVRRSAARVQSLLAGGKVLPGCVIFEGIVFLLLAGGLALAFLCGWL